MKSEAPAGPFPFWRNPMVLLVAGIITLVVGGNGIMIWIAVDTRPDLVAPDYYAASKRVDQEVAAQAETLHQGWRVTPMAGNGPAALTLIIAERDGRPVTGLTGDVRAYRPADAALDQPLGWEDLPGRPGRYRLAFKRPAPGLWRIRLDLWQGERRLYQEVRWVAPPERP